MTTTDVLVVGAGPTGLTAAASLAGHGVATTVVDSLAAGANTSRAVAVAARTLEVLEGVDVGKRLAEQGIHAPRFSIRDRRRTLMSIDFSGLPTNYPYTLTISQADTERVLLDRATDLGAEVLRPKTLTGIEQSADAVVANFDDGEPITARFVIGADGMHSAARENSHIGFHGGEYQESFALADIRLDGDAPTEEIVLFFAGAGLLVVVPLPGGIHRIVAPVEEPPEEPTAEFAQELLDTRGVGPGQLVVSDVLWGSHFRIHHRVADTYRAGRVLLAGDSAHVHSPAGGQGMNLGIQDAAGLAEVLARVLAGGPDTLLDSYSKSRRPIAKQVVAFTDRLTRLATTPRAARPARNAAMRLAATIPAVRNAIAWRLSGLVYRDRESVG
ncbi:pentachlorophenol monooxygenase [Mycobacterium colombiense]|uniref:Pentachlorophenol monooxygenase n=1 Tax=Mycobacterium colombiense TaxID=339268 RepID=A0A1A0VD27_9MYCO|nr:FAD-dependent monooxygenase [Mycobacterium colombiense]OBB81170.1 pentachlorophenol monooxygenase [Mycobacterium colombiense]